MINQGIAVDCCGREVVLCQRTASPEIDWSQGGPGKALILCLTYCRESIDAVPVIFDAGACADPRQEASRFRDGYHLDWHWIPTIDLGNFGWRTPPASGLVDPDAAGPPQPPRTDCGGDHHDGGGCCEIQCPPGHCIPLAIVEQYQGTVKIDMGGRPRVRPAWRHLTHINWYNWPHGGTRSVKWLQENPLKVSFDRKLLKDSQEPGGGGDTQLNEFDGRGINRVTFKVEYGGVHETPDAALSEHGPRLVDGYLVEYRIDRKRVRDMIGDIVIVTIHCDFVLDCNREPVDGNHLGGLVPTGDGIAGGTFRSCFLVTD